MIQPDQTSGGISTIFEIKDYHVEKADTLLRQRNPDMDIATKDRGRDKAKRREDSFYGVLGEVLAVDAFCHSIIEAEHVDTMEYDFVLSLPTSQDKLTVENKTRISKDDSYLREDIFLRKSPSDHEADILFGIKVYPEAGDNEWGWAKILGYCSFEHADKWKLERDDLSHFTNKWEIRRRFLRDDYDRLENCIRNIQTNTDKNTAPAEI